MYEEIIYEVEDPVATITINRPERLNALTARTQVELKHAMIAAERDERVIGIILTGAGRAFSAARTCAASRRSRSGGASSRTRAWHNLRRSAGTARWTRSSASHGASYRR